MVAAVAAVVVVGSIPYVCPGIMIIFPHEVLRLSVEIYACPRSYGSRSYFVDVAFDGVFSQICTFSICPSRSAAPATQMLSLLHEVLRLSHKMDMLLQSSSICCSSSALSASCSSF